QRRINNFAESYLYLAKGGRYLAKKGFLLTLTCLIARVLLVNHINPALAANHAAMGFALFERLKGIGDFHSNGPCYNWPRKVGIPARFCQPIYRLQHRGPQCGNRLKTIAFQYFYTCP